MKSKKIVYWASTGIIALFMLFSAYKYFTDPAIVEAYVHLGFPDYLRKELGIAKIIGAMVLIIPGLPIRLKEWAYAGFFINFFSASLAHYMSGDPTQAIVTPLVLIFILMLSNVYLHKLKNR